MPKPLPSKAPQDRPSRRATALFLGGLLVTPLVGGAMLLVVGRGYLQDEMALLALMPPTLCARLAYQGALEMTYGQDFTAAKLKEEAATRDREVRAIRGGDAGMALYLVKNLGSASWFRVVFAMALFFTGLTFSAMVAFLLVGLGL